MDNKNAIEKFAKWARRDLIERVALKAAIYGVTAENPGDPNADYAGERLFTNREKELRKKLIQAVKDKGFDRVVENAAYAWFNRFTALRFMEVNGYLDVRVFTNAEGKFKPQILDETFRLDLDGLDPDELDRLSAPDKREELYQYLLLRQCDDLGRILPGVFEKIDDYLELLIPDYLIREGSVVERMVSEIPEDDWHDQVQIVGWLYQYYISEKHEEVVDPLHGKIVRKEEIPAATQLFTTDWVVRYLLDNSLGRYWLERNPNSRLADSLAFLAKPKNGEIKRIDEAIRPQDLTVLDPCVGSGHFLVYAFDLLLKIYLEYGYSESEAAVEIVKNNLYGLDIDNRAVQLAYFAVMMKARRHDKRFFSRGLQPHIFAIVESNKIDEALVNYFTGKDLALKADVGVLLRAFEDAEEYGAIIQTPDVNFARIRERFAELSNESTFYDLLLRNEFQPLVDVAEAMSRKYAVVATNPPYLNKFDDKLKAYINKHYADYKGDLFSVFIYRNFDFCKAGGYSSFMTPFVWMFIQTYEKLRRYILENKHIVSLILMEYSAYEEATVPICAFVLQNSADDSDSLCFRLSDFKGGMEVQKEKVLEAIKNPDCGFFYETQQDNFSKIPGSPLGFWATEKVLSAYSSFALRKYVDCRSGIMTGCDEYIKFWFEPNQVSIRYDCSSYQDMKEFTWFPLNSGGGFRKWYGNNIKVVNLKNDGTAIKANVKNYRLRDPKYYFKRGITWGRITSSQVAFREVVDGSLFGDAGPVGFVEDLRHYFLGFLNSKVIKKLLQIANPTLNFQVHDIMDLPIIIEESKTYDVEKITSDSIRLSKSDWDSFETSWDFSEHPFITHSRDVAEENEGDGKLIEAAFERWRDAAEERFRKLRENEEELNRIFIEIYGLQDELTPEVEEKDVTVRRADLGRDVRSFISYAVGCMFGRYSLDAPGLAFAGGAWDETKYRRFKPDPDNIIPIFDDEYSDDDIVARFAEFVKVAFGAGTLEANLKFVADALGGKGSARDVLRSYFIDEFYADHLKIYQKSPIYWLFDSGKKNGFKCLIYLHRYAPDLLSRIRSDYVHELQSRYWTAIDERQKQLDALGEKGAASERVKLKKILEKLRAQSEELRVFEENVHHLADRRIELDLDDGVKHNYELFKDALAKIK